MGSSLKVHVLGGRALILGIGRVGGGGSAFVMCSLQALGGESACKYQSTWGGEWMDAWFERTPVAGGVIRMRGVIRNLRAVGGIGLGGWGSGGFGTGGSAVAILNKA